MYSGDSTATTNAPAIEFRNVTIGFDEGNVLDGIDLTLERHRLICIIGLSGSGKTVLLHCAVGLLTPDEGEILINGKHIEHMSERDLLELRKTTMGLVFQEDALFTSKTVYDNAAYRLVESDWPEADIDRSVREMLTLIGLDAHMDKIPEELSIGMRRRLEVARDLIGWPSIMLFDEPTSGLDPVNSRNVLDLVIRARDMNGVSALLVTKEPHLISYLATHTARRDSSGEIVIEKDATAASEKTTVMLLENGRFTFSGGYAEFEESRLPGVLQMTHPEAIAQARDSYVPGLWKSQYRPR